MRILSTRVHGLMDGQLRAPWLVIVGLALQVAPTPSGMRWLPVTLLLGSFVLLMGFATMSYVNGRDLTGWKGLPKAPNDNPAKRARISPEELEPLQQAANERMRQHWSVKNGAIEFDGKGDSLCTARNDYGDFEMLVDWKILEKGDSGFRINRIDLVTEASVPGIDEAAFQDQAETAKANCPVSQALAGTQITLKATLV